MKHTTGRHRATEIRNLHLIDLENLISGIVTDERVRAVWDLYVAQVGVRRDDAVIVAMAGKNAEAAVFALPSAVVRVIGADGPDGADIALVNAVDVSHAAARYQRVFLASGDHFFTGIAEEFRAAGRPVTQVVGAGAISAQLYRACSAHTYLRVRRPAKQVVVMPQHGAAAS